MPFLVVKLKNVFMSWPKDLAVWSDHGTDKEGITRAHVLPREWQWATRKANVSRLGEADKPQI